MLFIVSIFFIGLSSKYNKATELIYTNVVNKFLREKLSLIFGQVEIPVGDIITLLLVLLLVIAILNFIRNILSPKKWLSYLYKLFWGLVNTVCISMLLFVLLGGLNYHTPDLVSSLIDKYNHRYATEVKVNPDNAKKLEVYKFIESKAVETKTLLDTSIENYQEDNINVTSDKISQGYRIISDVFPNLSGVYSNPKSSFKSHVFNFMGLDARYYMLTNEVSISDNIPQVYRPFVIGKYMAYQRGVVREDEASFYSYLAMINSSDQYIRYLGYISMLEILSEGLKDTDKIEYNNLMASQNSEIKSDLNKIRVYKSSYGVGKEFTDMYNYTFRRINGDVRVDSVESQVAYILATYYSLSPY